MKLKKIFKISLILICLLICINNVVYADMSIDAMERMSWIGKRESNVINLSLIAMVITISIELIIARCMNIKHYKVIFLTNLITQLFLHINTINLFSLDTFNSEPIITIFLEFIIWFVEFLIYMIMFSEYSEKKIFTYVMIANIVTFIAPYIILWNTYNLSNNYNGNNIISYNVLNSINSIIKIMYFISLIVTIILYIKIDKEKKINSEKENINLRKKLLLSRIAIILLGITNFNYIISNIKYITEENEFVEFIEIFAPLISFIIIIRIFIQRLKTKKWF